MKKTDNHINHKMSKAIINSYNDFEQYIGKELGVSDYLKITQEHINKFAEATLDFQWIHVDVERAKVESPYKSTIAHGYLNLAVLPYLWGQLVEVNNIKMTVNYGIENLRFNQPVLANDEVRLRAKLESLINLRGITKAKINVSLEILGNKKPALDATIVFLYHFI
jgi:acyl dehydratase